MKTLFFFLLFPVCCHAQPLVLPRKIASELKEMVYFHGGTITVGMAQVCFPDAGDSALCAPLTPKRVAVREFYLSDHEVTNAEYTEFLQWGRDSTGEENPLYAFDFEGKSIVVNLVPKWNDVFSKARFENQLGNNTSDCPVACISFYQALAYCSWKTDRVNERLAASGSDLKVVFTLPTANQWQYAAIGESSADPEVITERPEYPWSGRGLLDSHGRYCANFGEFRDENGVLIKVRMDDGFYESAPVKQFAPNRSGLYDLAGNVAEWTIDDPAALQFDTEREQSFAARHGKVLTLTNEEKAAKYAPARVVKGGSYADSPVYLMNASAELYNEETSLPTIGFRVAMVKAE